MADKTYRLDFALSNGAKKSVQFTAPQGPRGESGVYILADGETISDAPADANVVIDPNGSADFTGGTGGGASSWEDLGSTYTEGVALAECTPSFDEDQGGFVIADVVLLTVGNEYTVNWNGVEYNAVASEFELDGLKIPCLGDPGVLMGDEPSTGHPFAIMCFTAETADMMGVGCLIYPLDGSAEVTLSISCMMETITPIPAKYMPPALMLYPDNNRTLYKDPDTSNRQNCFTKEELQNAVTHGSTLFVYYSDDTQTIYDSVIRIEFKEYQGTNCGLVYTHYNEASAWIAVPKAFANRV